MFAQEESISWGAALGVAVPVGMLMVIAGLAVITVAVRTADGRLGRGRAAGIRTAATMASDEAWLAAHQKGERGTKLGGVLFILAGLAPLVFGLPLVAAGSGGAESFMTWWAVLLMGGTCAAMLAVLVAAVAGHRAARAVTEASSTHV